MKAFKKEIQGITFTIIIIFLFILGILLMGEMGSDSNYVRANRYSGCIERLSKNIHLRVEDVKEVCSEYLKD